MTDHEWLEHLKKQQASNVGAINKLIDRFFEHEKIIKLLLAEVKELKLANAGMQLILAGDAEETDGTVWN